MSQVTVKQPDTVQVSVSSGRIQNIFTTVDPTLRISPGSMSSTSVNLEGNTSVDVAGSLASIQNYFKALKLDFGDGSMALGSDTIEIFGANNTIRIGNGYITTTESGKIDFDPIETTINLGDIQDVPGLTPTDSEKFLRVNTAATGYEYVPIPDPPIPYTFSELTDTPSSLGTSNQFLRVSTDEQSLEFISPGLSDFTNDSGYLNSINNLDIGELRDMHDGASGLGAQANGFILQYISDTTLWTPVMLSVTESGAFTTLNGTQILDLLSPVDGTGSLLDADKLDGNQGDYYTTGTNINYAGATINTGSGNIITDTGKLAVGNTAPTHAFQVEEVTLDAFVLNVTSIGIYVIDEWDATKFRAAKYFITVTDLDTDDDGNANDPSYLAVEALVVHNGITSNITVFGEVNAGVGEVTEANFNADYDSINNKVRLLCTTTTENCTIKASRLALTS